MIKNEHGILLEDPMKTLSVWKSYLDTFLSVPTTNKQRNLKYFRQTVDTRT